MFLERVVNVGHGFEEDYWFPLQLAQFEVSLQDDCFHNFHHSFHTHFLKTVIGPVAERFSVETTNNLLFVSFTKMSFIKDVHSLFA